MNETTGMSEASREFMRDLASKTRQDLMLLFATGVELTVGEVADRSGLAPSTTSEQLAILRRGGLVTSRRDGKQVLYRADRDRVLAALDDLTSFLRHCC